MVHSTDQLNVNELYEVKEIGLFVGVIYSVGTLTLSASLLSSLMLLLPSSSTNFLGMGWK